MLFKDVDEIKDEKKEGEFHYYYNREEPIAKASPQVQEYYRGGMRPVRGFKVLFNRQNRFVLFALVIFVGSVWVYTGFNKTRAYSTIGDINFELTAFSYEEEVYTSIQMKPNTKTKKTKAAVSENAAVAAPKKVTAEIFVIDPNNQVGDKRTLSEIYAGGEQFLRTKFTDYDIIRVDVILNVDGEEKELSAQVKR